MKRAFDIPTSFIPHDQAQGTGGLQARTQLGSARAKASQILGAIALVAALSSGPLAASARASGGKTGESGIIQVVAGGAGTPPTLPANLLGLQSFRLNSGPPLLLKSGFDLDGDGLADLLWQHDDGWLAAWLMEGCTLVQATLLTPNRVEDPNWRIVGPK